MSESNLKSAMFAVAKAVAEISKEDPKIMDQLVKEEDFQQINEGFLPVVGGTIFAIKKIKARTEQLYRTPLVRAKPGLAEKVKGLHDAMVTLEDSLDAMVSGVKQSITGVPPEDQTPFLPFLSKSWREAIVLMFLDPFGAGLVAKINWAVVGLIALSHGMGEVVKLFGGLKPKELEMLGASEYEQREMSAAIGKAMKDRLKDKYGIEEQMQRMKVLAGINKKVL